MMKKARNVLDILTACALTACQLPPQAANSASKIDASALRGALSGIEHSGGSWRIFLTEPRPGDHLEYQIWGVGADKPLRIASSRYRQDGYEINIGSGTGIVIHVRDDGKALFIDEWENCAVAEGLPIYVSVDGNAVVKPYDVSRTDAPSSPGQTSVVKFNGWDADGNPVVALTFQ